MFNPTPFHSLSAVVIRGFRTWALPRLDELPAAEWDKAIQDARGIDFDGVERVAIIVGVALVAYLLRIESGHVSVLSLPVIYLMQFIESIPLLILVVSPVFLCRARRGLDKLIADRRDLTKTSDGKVNDQFAS